MVDVQTTTFQEIDKNVTNPIVLFGEGNIAKKTLRKLDSEKVVFIADNSDNLQGEEYLGYPIKPPSEISNDHFVIITSTAIADISGQLKSMGLLEKEDFVISPVLNDRIGIIELEYFETEFFFTSGAVSGTDKYGKYGNNKYGGGLFKCQIDGLEYEYEQLYEGASYGSIRHGDRILFVDHDVGLMEYSNGSVNKILELPSESRAHGISYNESTEKFYIACTYRDSVLEVDESFSIVREFKISNKIEYYGEDMHHCNDCLSMDNSLYVTMFSSSGNWKNDAFDGCITEFNIETGERLRDVQSDLWMPHNVDFFNGSLHVLESLTGELRFNNLTVQGSFPAFSRGLDYDQGIYFIGQSKNRNHSKVLGDSTTTAIDCGVVLFDPELQISRFLHFPDVGGIHSITC